MDFSQLFPRFFVKVLSEKQYLMKSAIIIGAGIGGIATSIRLANKGYQVQVFESTEKPGGKLNEFKLGDYRFDFGPSLFTLPDLVLELFEISGKNYKDYFEFQKMDLACQYFWEDKVRLKAWSDQEKFAKEAGKVLGINEKNLKKYLKSNERIYKLTSPLFLERSLHSIKGLFSIASLKAGLNFHRMNIFTSMSRVNKRKLKNPKLVQLFNRMATYNGSSPYKAPGILNIISSLEHGSGVYFPEGGMYSITKSLVRLAEELGVKFCYNEKVTEILHKEKSIKGVKTSRNEYFSDIVVSNSDIVPTYRYLLPKIREPKRIFESERSSSAIVFYWGIDQKFDELELHNIFFSDHYETEFDHLFNKKEMFADPTVYVHVSTKAEPKDAPVGKETWFVMVNAPANYGQDWDNMISSTRENVLKKLERNLDKNIRDHIEEEWILDPRIIEEKTFSFRGSLYGTSSNSKFAAFLRHPNFSTKLKGLYFVGGSVHPGGGIPLCLLSAKIVGEMVN